MALDIEDYINLIGRVKMNLSTVESYLGAIMADGEITPAEEEGFRTICKTYLQDACKLVNTIAEGESLAIPTECYTTQDLEEKGLKVKAEEEVK